MPRLDPVPRSRYEERIQELQQQLDIELVDAMDRYYFRQRIAVLERLIEGEKEYKGKWKTLTPRQLGAMEREEELDIIAYRAMAEWNA